MKISNIEKILSKFGIHLEINLHTPIKFHYQIRQRLSPRVFDKIQLTVLLTEQNVGVSYLDIDIQAVKQMIQMNRCFINDSESTVINSNTDSGWPNGNQNVTAIPPNQNG